jgi:hypothetical protein
VIHLAAFLGAWLVGVGVGERCELGSARAGEARQAVELAQQQTKAARERASRAAAEERLRSPVRSRLGPGSPPLIGLLAIAVGSSGVASLRPDRPQTATTITRPATTQTVAS